MPKMTVTALVFSDDSRTTGLPLPNITDGNAPCKFS